MRSDCQLILNSDTHLQPAARERVVVMMMPVSLSRVIHEAKSKSNSVDAVKGWSLERMRWEGTDTS